MAQLEFNIKANFEEVTKLRSECEKLRAELLKTNKSTDPAIVADLTEKYADASNRLKDLTQAASRAAYVMSSEFNKKMQAAAREVYSYELQMQATKDRIEKIQQQITNKRLTLGITTDKSSIDSLQKNIDYLKGSLAGQTAQLKNLEGGAVGALQTLENMRNEYVLYAGSANPAKEATNMLTDSMSQMIERMKSAPTAGEGMTSLFQRVTGDAHMLSATLLGGLGFEQLTRSVFNTRSQFQQLEISFNTMLGSADKSKQLMDELIQTAAHTPFDMSSITGGAKQLLAYGTEAKDVNKTLVQLGDIASGLNIPLGDLVYLYGTTVSQGRMFTMDLRQFMGRGVPLAEELGKILHQNTTEVQESVSKGKVTSDIFKEAIANMTQAGGRFGGLMEQQSKTLEGQWSNIGDSIQQMFNEIGKKSEGVFSSGLSIISAMVENWQEVIKVIGVATVAVGSYRASLMAAASIRKAEEAQQADDMMKGIDAEIKRLQDLENSNYKSLGKDKKQERVSKQQDLASIVGDTAVSDDFVKARLDAAEQEGVITAQVRSQLEMKRELLQTQQQATAQSQIELDEEKRKTEELRQQKIESLKDDLKTTTEKISNLDDRDIELARQYTAALNDLQDAQDAFAEAQKLVEETADGANLAFDAEGNAVNALEAKERLATAAKKVNIAQTNVSTITSQQRGAALIREQLQERQATLQTQLNSVSQATNTTTKKASTLATAASTVKNAIHTASVKIMTTAELMLSNAVKSTTMALKGMWAAMLANPITGIITLVTTLASAVAMFGGEEEDISVDTKHFGDSAENTRAKVDGLLNVMKSSKEGTDAYNKAKEELIQTYEQFGIKCDAEKDNLTTLKGKHDEFVATLQLENAEREKANALMSATSQYTEARNKEDDNFSKDLSGHWYQGGQHVDKEDITSIQMMYNSIATDEVLDRLSKLKQRVDDSTLSYKEHIDAFNIYTNAVKKTFAPIDSFLEKQHYNIATIENTDHSILEHTSNLAKLKTSYKNAEDAIMKAAAENVDWNNTQARSQWVAQQNKQSIDALTSSTDQLISIWNQEYGLNLKIHYDDTEIPSWMKSLTDKQLQSLINRRKADLNRQEQYRTNHKGSKLLTKQGNQLRDENANRLDVAMAGSILKDREAKRKADANKPKETTKKTTPKKTGATDDPQARAYERKKAEEDYSKSISSYSEKASDELSKRRMELIKNETEKEIAKINMSSDKEKKAIEDSIDKLVEAKKKKDQVVWVNSGKGRKANMWKQEKSDAEYRKEVLVTQMVDGKGNHLGKTIGQNSEDQIALIEERRQLKLKEIQQAEVKEMLDFLKQYGTYQEKKYAIAKEYDEKINLETDTYKKASLEKEKSKAISDVDTSALQSQIDWQSVFGSMIGSLQEQLKETFQGLKEYTKTDDFKKKDATEQKVIYEAIDKMRGALTGDHEGTLNLSKLKRQSEDLGNAFKEMQAAGLREKIAFDNLQVAQDSYEKALKAGDKAQIKGASQTLDSAKAIYDSAKKTSEEMVKTVKAKGVEYKESSQGTLDGLNEVASGLKEFSGGSLSGLMSGLTNTVLGLSKLDLGKTLNNSVSKLADKLQSGGYIGQIISAILSILDILKDGIGSLVANVIDTILNAVNGILKNILTGKFVEQIGGSLLEGVGNILDTVTFGGLSSWLGDGSSDKNLEKDLARLSESNNNLKTSIDALADKMDEASSMQDITTSYEKQKEAIQDQIKNTQESMSRSGAAYTKGHWYKAYTDGHHSSNKKINDAMSYDDWNKVSKAAGVSVRSASDFWNLTSEQMANVSAYAATQYDKIKQYGDDGYKNASQYMDSYIEYYKELEQLENTYREKLTSISFDSVESDFKSMLENMDSDSTDFADSFQKKMASAIINSLMVNKYKQRLQDWYKTFSSTFENKNLTKEELYKAQDKLKQEYMAISKDALGERDSLKDALGWNDNFSQSASSGSFESMSQDTGDELNGRFTAVQIATEGTYEETKLINTKLDAIAARNGGAECSLLTASVNTIMGNVGNIWLAVDEGRTILAQSLMYLQSIDERQERWHKPMLQAFNDIHELKDKMSRL